LTAVSLEDENSIEQPRKVAPVTHSVSAFAQESTRTFVPRSLTILRLRTRRPSAAHPVTEGNREAARVPGS